MRYFLRPGFFGFAYASGFYTFLVAAPIGMLFATSRDGRSHCPEKWTEELAPGLRP